MGLRNLRNNLLCPVEEFVPLRALTPSITGSQQSNVESH